MPTSKPPSSKPPGPRPSGPGPATRSGDAADGDAAPAGPAPGWPLAVAIRKRGAADAAPRVVASGRGAVAEQILNLAFAHGVRVREDADLASILAAVEVDCEIPLEALAAVAEILSYVYRANAGVAPPHSDQHFGGQP